MKITEELRVFDWITQRMSLIREYSEAGKLEEVKVYNTFFSLPNGVYIQFKCEIKGNFIAKPYDYDENGKPVPIKSLENHLQSENFRNDDFCNLSYSFSDERLESNYNWVVVILNRFFPDLVHKYFKINRYQTKENWRDLAIQCKHELYAEGKVHGK